jgi:Tfp pilus assembly protein PilE
MRAAYGRDMRHRRNPAGGTAPNGWRYTLKDNREWSEFQILARSPKGNLSEGKKQFYPYDSYDRASKRAAKAEAEAALVKMVATGSLLSNPRSGRLGREIAQWQANRKAASSYGNRSEIAEAERMLDRLEKARRMTRRKNPAKKPKFRGMQVVFYDSAGKRTGAMTPAQFRAAIGARSSLFLADAVKQYNDLRSSLGGDRAEVDMRINPPRRRKSHRKSRK